MTKQEFQNLFERGVVLLDGAAGTNLQQAGMPGNACPEQWILEHPDVMRSLQRSYVEAGTQILYAPTFTGNRIKLAEYGLADQLADINTRLVALAKEAAQGQAFVAGDLTMTGQQLYPLGELQFEQLVDIYKEQAKVLCDAGADLFVVETMMSLQETRAAVIAIKEICDLPVMASLTFEDDGRTLFGTNPETAVVVLQSLGVDAVGLNCSTGPMEMVEIVGQMYAYANIPILAKPNAGLPELENGQTVYKTSPQEFAEAGKKLVDAGIETGIVIGGGNFWRGRTSEAIDRTKADQIGMLATVMNCIYVSEIFRTAGMKTNVLTPFSCGSFTKLFSKDRANKYFAHNMVVFFAGGTGHPYFSTDTATVLRAIEIEADGILLAKSIDGVYDSDPKINPDAVRYDTLSIDEVIAKKLAVIDLTASIMCMEHKMPMYVFSLNEPDSIVHAISGNFNGTVITV